MSPFQSPFQLKSVPSSRCILFPLILAALTFTCGSSHVQLVEPLPRGSLRGTSRSPSVRAIDRRAPVDGLVFYPAGNRGILGNGRFKEGAGKESQRRAVRFWRVFEPSSRGFPWRAGVCGDVKTKRLQDHRVGGRFFYNAKISKSYLSGSIIDLKVSMNQNHNGYFVFHVCDASKCGGDILPSCFERGFCRKLRRVRTPACDDRQRPFQCGPIDRNNPDRWYVPCARKARNAQGLDNYGFSGEMKYRLPAGFVCNHCVLHFYHTSANNCLPPGTTEYFTGPDRPSWGQCIGEGGARGQFAAGQGECGGEVFAEEYYNCADIRIATRQGLRANPISKVEFGEVRFGTRDGFFPWKILPRGKLTKLKINRNKRYTVLVSVKWPVKKMSYRWQVGNGRIISANAVPIEPFYVFGVQGTDKPKPWRNPQLLETHKITVVADGQKWEVRVLLS